MLPDTAASMQALWDERDARYSRRRRVGMFVPLTPAEVWSVRAFRRTEIASLAAWEQGPATAALAKWAPSKEIR